MVIFCVSQKNNCVIPLAVTKKLPIFATVKQCVVIYTIKGESNIKPRTY